MEMIALVRAKKQEFIKELDADNPRELMSTEMTKWERISMSMNTVEGMTCFRSIEACKYKWQQLLPDYKKVANLYKGTETNAMLYFDLSFANGGRECCRRTSTPMSTRRCTNG
jgi:hypothetical protein